VSAVAVALLLAGSVIGGGLLPAASAAAPAAASEAVPLALETVAEGLDNPLDVVTPPRDPRRFVVEQTGRIRILRECRLLPTPFLDLRARLLSGGERGLLSMAFHPRYAENGFFYVNYTDRHGDTRIERYHVSPDPDRADPASAHLVLQIAQPYANHNGGLVMFGPDGMFYVGMGDGGSGGDPHGNGQNPATLLGKLLRIDVDHGDPYAVPRDNPFVGRAGFRPEIWALGLRNPWRFCFDPPSGLLVIADVGQDKWEEIDAVDARRGGWNFGWNLSEGRHVFHEGTASVTPVTAPVEEYGHDRGCSIIGGFVYRGHLLPALAGLYFYSDYCDSRLHAVRIENGRVTERHEWNVHARGAVSSFGVDREGELYVTTFDGRVSRIVHSR
jgi:glucose/arabinose dehydrogenase